MSNQSPLTEQTAQAIGWIVSVLERLRRNNAAPLFTVITASLISRVSSTLAFLIPLKVILLASSPGIPSYFQAFITPAWRETWILILAAGAVVSYILSVTMDMLATRVSDSASATIIAQANPITLPKQQHEQGRQFYSRFCQLAAAALFSAVGVSIGLLVNPPPFLAFLAFALTVFLLSSLILASRTPLLRGFRALIAESTADYVRFMSSLAFLIAFFVILVPFVWGGGNNVLLALIAIILIRQVLTALTLTVNETVNLSTNRDPVNALIFPGAHLPNTLVQRQPAFSELFQKERREKAFREAFITNGRTDIDAIETEWLDSGVRTLRLFNVQVCENEGQPARYQLQVLPPKGPVTFEQEEFLLRHTASTGLPALPILFRYKQEGFYCQVRDLQNTIPTEAKDWQVLYPELLVSLWCQTPDAELVAAYTASYPLLPERLHEKTLTPLQPAADTQQRKETFEKLLEQLPAIREFLNTMPLYISNRAINLRNLAKTPDNKPVLMSWADWEIDIVGSKLPPHARDDKLSAMLDFLNSEKTRPESLRVRDILIVKHLSDLERHIKTAHLIGALESAQQALEEFTSL